jgi:hypothetical protein
VIKKGPGLGWWTGILYREGKQGVLGSADCSSVLDCLYLKLGRIKRMQRQLDHRQGEWVTTYMHGVIHQTRGTINVTNPPRRIDRHVVGGEKTAGRKWATSDEDESKTESNQWRVVDPNAKAEEAEILQFAH